MKLTDKESVGAVIRSLTLEEKAALLQGASIFKTAALPEHNIPALYMLDGGTGMCFRQTTLEAFNNIREDGKRGLNGLSSLPGFCERERIIQDVAHNNELEGYSEETKEITGKLRAEIEKLVPGMVLSGCYPPGMVLGSTWDEETVYETAKALGKECHYYNLDILLGTPNVNIHRNPLNGRVFEGYSEDPCLTSELAPEFVKGLQSEGVTANVKHFAANNQETNRREINEHITERALREIYLPGFKACVDAGCRTVMSAYNYINGVPCSQNRWLLTDVLRKEWGFRGFVVSDWGGVYHEVEALKAGNDLEMPANARGTEVVIEAVKNGTLPEAVLDESLERYLTVLLDCMAVKGRKYTEIDREGSREAAYRAASEGMVLLKNNGVLPFGKDTSAACIGPLTKHFMDSGNGSANVVTDQTSSLYECLQNNLPGRVTYEELRDDTNVLVVAACALGAEGFDRKRMDLEPEDKQRVLDTVKLAKEKNLKVVLLLNVCGPVDVRDYAEDVDAILFVGYPGMEGGHAAADILTGKVNPSGKLPITFPRRYEDCPSSIYFPGRNLNTIYGEDIFVGYRWYDYRNIEPMYPFGYGLSYTTFALSEIRASRSVFRYDEEQGLTLSVKVTNTGTCFGKEVIQVYVGQRHPTLIKPVKELKCFKKIGLQPGESTVVTFAITKEMLQSYDEEQGAWTVEPGDYDLYVGTSSRKLDAVIPFRAEGWNSFGFSENTKLDILVKNPEAFRCLQEYIRPAELTQKQIREWVLFQKAPSVAEYWEQHVASVQENAAENYQEMLKKLNLFS